MRRQETTTQIAIKNLEMINKQKSNNNCPRVYKYWLNLSTEYQSPLDIKTEGASSERDISRRRSLLDMS